MITTVSDKEIAKAAEIEQLRQEVTAWIITVENLEAERDALRAKLADSEALLENEKQRKEHWYKCWQSASEKLADQTKAADHWMGEACKSHNDLVRANEKLAALLAQEPVAWLYEMKGRIKLETKRIDNYWRGEGYSWVKGKPLFLAAGAGHLLAALKRIDDMCSAPPNFSDATIQDIARAAIAASELNPKE